MLGAGPAAVKPVSGGGHQIIRCRGAGLQPSDVGFQVASTSKSSCFRGPVMLPRPGATSTDCKISRKTTASMATPDITGSRTCPTAIGWQMRRPIRFLVPESAELDDSLLVSRLPIFLPSIFLPKVHWQKDGGQKNKRRNRDIQNSQLWLLECVRLDAALDPMDRTNGRLGQRHEWGELLASSDVGPRLASRLWACRPTCPQVGLSGGMFP